MATGVLTVSGNVTGGPDGSWSTVATRAVPAAVQSETIVALTSGSVTVVVPSGVTNVIIYPPNSAYPIPNPSYAGAITLKGIAGDTGVPISTTYVTVLEIDAATAPASFVLTATAVGSCPVRFF